MTRTYLWLVALATGCLDPQVDDLVGASPDLLPAGSTVPRVEDDPALRTQLEANDGVTGLIPLINGFAEGAPIRVWDFGVTPPFAAPLFVVMERDADGTLQRTPHNTIIEAMPGDPGYSPYWAVFVVEVTADYAGELLTSPDAIQSAVDAGLVRPPVRDPKVVNCPAAGPDVTLDVGDGRPPLPPPSNFYYRGMSVGYYDFGEMPLMADRVGVPESPHYVIRREGGEPLSEPIRGIDMVGDGDLTDTNDIYVGTADDPMRSPLCRTIEVAVDAAIDSIDTSRDDAVADLRSADQIFAPGPVPGVVSAFDVTDLLWNCPAQRTPGGL